MDSSHGSAWTRCARVRPVAKRVVLVLGATASVSLGLVLAAAPAGAAVKTIEATQVGLQPREVTSVAAGLLGAPPPAESFNNDEGHAVVHGSHVYAIYWDPTDHYHGDWQRIIDTFLQGMGAESGSLSNVFSVDTQYTDKSNTPASYQATLMGTYTDTHAYPLPNGCKDPAPLAAQYRIGPGHTEVCLTNKQMQEELETFISQQGLPKGMHTVYYILTPPAVTVCVDKGSPGQYCSDYSGLVGETSYKNSLCSYHSAINPDAAVNGDGNTVLYAVIPWTAGGVGDFGLPQTQAYDCQDGGFDPTSKPVIEEPEPTRHAQEPNQNGIGPDGYPDSGLADLIINQIAVEQQNTVTDPLLNAWKDTSANANEATDECRNFFAQARMAGAVGANELTGAGTLSNQLVNGVPYYLQMAFNMAALRLPYPAVPCIPGAALAPSFTAPNTVNNHELVSFDGMESNISLNATSYFPTGGGVTTTYATYTWEFGDGTSVSGYAPGAPVCSAPWLSPCAGSVFHSYEYGGSYTVTLTVTDVGGHKVSAERVVTVEGPRRSEGKGANIPTGPSSSSAGSSAAAGSAGGKPAGTPVATTGILSRSLKQVLSNGLLVHYSVNEQVAGHFEVLLAASLAKRIGVHGAPATGLAVGTPPQIVIGRAIVVTTKAGQSTLRIQFAKNTSNRLRRLGKVSLMVRLVVRNASGKNPLTTTVLSVITLKH